MGDVFFCITLSILVIRYWWKHQHFKFRDDVPTYSSKPVKNIPIADKTEEQKQYEKDVEDLRRQGYTDEIIAVILPTINSGQ